jgi:hypothetical protein
MTANLRAAIEQLLLRAEASQPADAATTMLRARLIADLSGALTGKRVESDGVDPPEIDDDQFLNDVAVYLEGRCSEEERMRVIDAMARAPDRRAMVESAAEFLHELEVASEPMPPDLLAEAKALFAPSPTLSSHLSAPDIPERRLVPPQIVAPPIVSPQALPTSAIASIAPPRFWRRKPQHWKSAAGIAALLMVGAIGTFDVVLYSGSNSAPALRLAALKQADPQRSAGKDASRAPSFDPASAPTAPIRGAALDDSRSEKNAFDYCDTNPPADTSSSSAYTKRLLAELENSHRVLNTMSNARDNYLEACRLHALLEQAQPNLAAAQPAPEPALALADPIKPSLVLAKPTASPGAAAPKDEAPDGSANCDPSRIAQAESGPSGDGPTTSGKNEKGSTVSLWAIAELMARTSTRYGGGRGRPTHDPCAVRAGNSAKPDRPSAQAAASPPQRPAKSATETSASSWSSQPLSTGAR